MAPSFDDTSSLFDFVVRKGNGVKGLVDSGIENVPRKYIQPASERILKIVGNENSSYHNNVSPIDLSLLDGPNHDQVVKAIVTASETLGFFQVVNHGVPVDLLDSLKQAAHRFFAQSPEKKAVYLPGEGRSRLVKYGTSFAPEKEKALEWKDYLNMVYSNEAEALEHWPKLCKEEALEYLKSSNQMVRRLLKILFENLGVKLEESRLGSLIGLKMVNMNFYPACPNPDLTVGVGRHSDMGTLTILLQDGIGGLHVKVEEDFVSGRKEEWIEIPPCPGALVINVGDAVQILSNGRYKSAEHRVRTTSKQSRVSVPIFTIPKPTEKIGPLPQLVERDGMAHYKEVVFQDYMNNFFGKAHEGKKSLDFARVN
ncbi:OLC1v1005801C1 [Oldenlandia corymbosa var. corymbosa]|uniref:feruloyl-CoA 6-hydroxylase n=1 Tax=Oldenlandia corymbosa var. corymbosa TaxID=529605 RepID=A0AAV1DIE5_OLDCO|nr:OLC1v1005801C1 [Oldenlandia corymbosa var. corymbosa]